MRSFRTKHNLVAVSANLKETAINTEQTLDTTMLVDISDMADVEPRRENNVNELTGLEEADTVYDLGKLSRFPMTFNKAQPQHFAFMFAYGLGSVIDAAAGTGYLHTITPIIDDLDAYRSNASFTAAMRFGKTVAKRRFAGMFINSFVATFAKDDWCKISGEARGTGKVTNTVTEETISALETVTSLTLAANGVAGSTAAERLDNVHRIRVELATGVWTEVAFSAVSSATPAVITITAPGVAATLRNYKVLYAATEPAWATFPERVVETPLRVAQLSVNAGGTWTGSAFSGGKSVNVELNSITWNYNNNLAIEFIPGAGDAYASRCFRPARTQTLAMNREFRDFVLQNYMDYNETFGIRILAEGAIYDDPHKYQVEIIFPKVGVLKSPLSSDNMRNVEAGDLTILQDATYGSVITNVKNKVAKYAGV